MKQEQIQAVQEWLPISQILENGIIKLKENRYIKIIKIIPVNYNLKSDLEKEAILNSYKTFLKTCNFDMQLVIQSNRKDLSTHIQKIKKQNQEKNKNILILSENYIEFIQRKNQEQHSSSKNFYIVIQKSNFQNKNIKNFEEIIIQELNENYLKIKECLSRCGNLSIPIEEPQNIIEIFKSFLGNSKNNFLFKEEQIK